MMRLISLALASLGLAGVAFAQEPTATVRARLSANDETMVGERTVLVVELIVPGFFAGTAAYDLPNVPGALLLPPVGSPILSSEQDAGVSYTVQRHELFVFARRAGRYEIPPIAIRLQFKRNPLDQETVAQTVQTPPLSFSAKQPPGAENLSGIICARGLKIEETWKPELGKAKAGDAFTRTIEFSAPEVPAMAFPEFPASKIDGLGIYSKTPEVLDRVDRGTLLGQRRDVVTYVCERAGRFVIPETKLTWWDLDAKQLRTISFPRRTIDVAPNPASPSTAESSLHSRIATEAVKLFGLIVLIAGAAFLIRKLPLGRIWQRIRAPLRPVRLQPLNPVR